MPLYFFDIRDGDEVLVDDEGMNLLTLDDVQEEAARSLVDMAKEGICITDDGSARYMAIEVRNDLGLVLRATVTFEIERLQ
jgi:hypothetical protein